MHIISSFRLGLILSSSVMLAWGENTINFTKQVQPILESACVNCHGQSAQKGDYALHTAAEAFKPIDDKPALVPGKPEESLLYTTTILPADHDDIMPPKKDGPPLDASQTEILKAWITQGANFPAEAILEQKPRILFVDKIQPILEKNCVGCHNPEKAKGGYDLTTKNAAFKGGDEYGAGVTPFDPEKSSLYVTMALPADHDDLMPPKKNGGPLPAAELTSVKLWIEQGAVWPDDLPPLKQKAAGTERPPNPDDLELVKKIHAHIMATSGTEKTEADMKEYTSQVPKTGAKYTMVPIKAGEYIMGSPATEKGRKEDEGPQTKVKINPFWMGKYEVTWNEYLPFQVTPVDRYKDGAKKTPNATDAPVDIVSSPTSPYTEMSFGMGQDGYPAISMTEHAALKYCQWLSAQTGHFYRLPTEAEWEYACRAGTTTAYHFGDDASQLGEYAWFFDNSPDNYQKVGQKKPNPWGLHDMHGNVLEWVLDQYEPGYQAWNGDTANPWRKPSTLWGRTVRGGSYYDEAVDLRSAARRASKEQWKQQDPQLPKSIWYLTDARWLGFRLVRPLEIPSPEEMFYIWNCGRPEELAKITGGTK